MENAADPRVEIISSVVYARLAEQLGVSLDVVAASDQDLEELGLDSHGLMTVLLAVEQACQLETSLDVDDDALASPQALVAALVETICAVE